MFLTMLNDSNIRGYPSKTILDKCTDQKPPSLKEKNNKSK